MRNLEGGVYRSFLDGGRKQVPRSDRVSEADLMSRRRMRFSLMSVLVILWLFFPEFGGTPKGNALGQTIGSDGMIDVQSELDRMQAEIDQLKAATTLTAPSPPPPVVPICCEPAAKKPSYPTVRLTGFFQADAAWFNQSLANRIAVGNGDPVAGDVQDGADFRRARVAAVGEAWDNVSYMLEMDFAFPGHPSFMDVWVDIENAVGRMNLRIGQFRHPFGMDGLTGVKELTFLERGLPFAFLPFRQIGAMLYGHSPDELATYAVSVYRYPTDVYGGNIGDNGGFGMASRATGLLFGDGDQGSLLHLGGGYCYIDPANDQLQYRNQPEIFVGETGGGVPAGVPANVPAFVDTGVFAADNANLFNIELAHRYGSLYTQSEVFYTRAQQTAGPQATFTGAYAYAGYFLTGETRPYNGDSGTFGRVIPCRSVGKQGGIGAWEIAGRWSYLDLNDANLNGGRLNDLTAGLNWYLNPRTKFQFNYIHAMLDSPINGNSDADVFATRVQVDF